MWGWLILGAIGLFAWSKAKANAAAQQNAANGVTTNPLQNFWQGIMTSAANLRTSAQTQATNQANSILSGVFSNIGGGSKGANSPQTAGSGTQAPQVNAGNEGTVSDSAYSDMDDTGDDYGGSGGEDYGGDDGD